MGALEVIVAVSAFLLALAAIVLCFRRHQRQQSAVPGDATHQSSVSSEEQSRAGFALPTFLTRSASARKQNQLKNLKLASMSAGSSVSSHTGPGVWWARLSRLGSMNSSRHSSNSSNDTVLFPTLAGCKSTEELCSESEAIAAFLEDPAMQAKRKADEDLTYLRLLAKGAFGEVFLGQYEDRHVAVKRLLPEKARSITALAQFMGEIQLMATLDHPRIVGFVGVAWTQLQNLCVLVEFMESGDLKQVLTKRKRALTWRREKIRIAMDMAEGLMYLHCLQPAIIHRDIKSKNVLLNAKLRAKLSDFGVSRVTQLNETLTSGVGTLLWTAPEIIEGRKYSEKADVYSLGVVLSELDTGESPFSSVKSDSGERLPGMQLAHLVRMGQISVSFRDDCPPGIRELAKSCTQLDPDLRPTSMQVAYTLKSIVEPTLRAKPTEFF